MHIIGVQSYLQSIVAASHTIGVRYDKPLAYIGCFAGNRGSSCICAATQVMEIIIYTMSCKCCQLCVWSQSYSAKQSNVRIQTECQDYSGPGYRTGVQICPLVRCLIIDIKVKPHTITRRSWPYSAKLCLRSDQDRDYSLTMQGSVPLVIMSWGNMATLRHMYYRSVSNIPFVKGIFLLIWGSICIELPWRPLRNLLTW